MSHAIAAIGASLLLLGIALGIIIRSTPYRRSKDQRNYIHEKPQPDERDSRARFNRNLGIKP